MVEASRRHRVLFLQTSASGGGSKRSLYEQLRALDSDPRFETRTVCTTRGWFTEQLDRDRKPYQFAPGLERLPALNARMLKQHPLRFAAGLARLSPRLADLWALLNRLEPDCMILNEARDFPCLLPFFFGKRVIVQNSMVENEGDFWQGRAAVRLSHHLFGVSQPVVDHLIALGKDPARVHLVPLIVEGPTPAGQSGLGLRAELGIPPGEPLVGIVGAIHPRKGQIDLVDAFFRVADECPGHLIIAGAVTSSNTEAEDYRERLESRVREHPHGGRVHLLGWREDAASWFGELAVLAMPSTFEGLPRVAVEAVSHGIPLIGYDIPSIRAVVADEAGLLTPLGDVVRLSESLKRVLLEPVFRHDLGQRARQRWQSHFDPELLRRITRDAFLRVLNRTPAEAA